jgi:putative membrane protein
VGDYNLFLGSGAVVGLILWSLGAEAVGRTLVVYAFLSMSLSGIVLLVADRLALAGAGEGPKRRRGRGRTGPRRARRPCDVSARASWAFW